MLKITEKYIFHTKNSDFLNIYNNSTGDGREHKKELERLGNVKKKRCNFILPLTHALNLQSLWILFTEHGTIFFLLPTAKIYKIKINQCMIHSIKCAITCKYNSMTVSFFLQKMLIIKTIIHRQKVRCKVKISFLEKKCDCYTLVRVIKIYNQKEWRRWWNEISEMCRCKEERKEISRTFYRWYE